MTNLEIITKYIEENEIDFNYDGNNLLTFAQWKQKGYSVKKGQTAFVKIELWTFTEITEKDEKGNVEIDEKTGKPKKKKKFYLKNAALFTGDQVEKVKKASKKKAA